MRVRIFKPAKTAMQSGMAQTKAWVLEFEPQAARSPEPLMGWTRSTDTRRQVRLEFESKADAIAYAVKQGYAYSVHEPKARATTHKSYSDNFRYGRRGAWTH
jgi:NADH dehydrogenase ubiquinone Fe-S protein 4